MQYYNIINTYIALSIRKNTIGTLLDQFRKYDRIKESKKNEKEKKLRRGKKKATVYVSLVMLLGSCSSPEVKCADSIIAVCQTCRCICSTSESCSIWITIEYDTL